MTRYFFVLYNTSESAFYIDNQLGYTDDVLMAERYYSYTNAQDTLKYFKTPNEWKIKKVTILVDI